MVIVTSRHRRTTRLLLYSMYVRHTTLTHRRRDVYPLFGRYRPINRSSSDDWSFHFGDSLDLRRLIRWGRGRRTEALLLPQRNVTAMYERNTLNVGLF
jgi:hypothetical protein